MTHPPLARQLADFALDVHFDRLPPATVAQVKRLAVDTLGCALGAIGCAPARLVEHQIVPAGPKDCATVIGSGAQTTAAHAVLVNGALTRYLDFMDVYWSRDVCHPSESIPAALAIAEAAGASGRQLIEAIVIGYETQLRLCDALAMAKLGFHHVSAAGFVVPLMAGLLWNLPAERLAHAVALGGVRHMTLSALSRGRLSMAKAIGYPLTAMESLFTTHLAASGMTGPLEALDWLFLKMPGNRGGEAAGAEPAGGEALIDLRHTDYRLERVSLKRYPVQFELQGPVEVAARLSHQLGKDVGTIERIEVEVLPITKERTADPAKFQPANRETADHSLPCCVAMALLDGDLTEHQFEHGRWSGADVTALASRTEVQTSEDFARRLPKGRPVAMTVYCAGRKPLRDVQEVPMGDADRPMDDAAVEAKFRGLAEPALGRPGATRVLELVRHLDRLHDLRELTAAMTVPR